MSQRPVEPTPQPGGGTVRPGAGRTSDTHVPPPPPPPQHQAGGTPRTLGDPNGSSSTPRTGRTGDEHLPPPPPPSGNSRIRPIDERPTPDELAQLHQHPDGPSLIHPPKANAAALAQYKSNNKFNFKLTGELHTAANTLPHSSWGRHDSGVQTPSGRPDVKVSPYSQSFKTHLDPLTLKALHSQAAGAITPHLRNELGPEAMAFQGNQVLEAAGNLDFRTQEHFQQQEFRRNVLERLARQDSGQTWHPVGEQRVNDHLDGSTSAMDGVNRLLGGHDGRPGFDGIVLGEAHNQSPSWRFLNENMHDLKTAGVDRIYVESLRDDAFQQHLNDFQRPGGTMSPNLEKMLRTYDTNLNSPPGHGLYDTVVRAKEEGVTIHAVDGYPARRPNEFGPQALQERARLLNSYMNHAISEGGGTGKYVLVTGKAHVHEHANSNGHRIPGVAEMLGAPAVRLTDSGRPNPNGAPHDASTATGSGNMRLGYLAPESTGHDPANAAGQHGNGAPPAPPAPPVSHQNEGSSSQSTRSLGGDNTPAPPAPPVSHQNEGGSSQSTRGLGGDNNPPAPPAPPTQHTAAGSSQSGHQPPAATTPNTTPNATPNTAPNAAPNTAPNAAPNTAPASGHTAPSTGGHNTPSTTGHTNPPATGHTNTPSTSAHDQFLDRQKQARDAELQALSGKSPVRDAVGQLGREQRAVATPPPGADRLRQDLPTMSAQERTRELAGLTPENRRWLARDPQTVDALKNSLPPKEFAKTAAELMVHVDPRAERAPSARQEAQQQIARMLQDPETTARLLKNGADVVVVPKDVRMPDVPELNNLRGVHNNSSAGAGRGYDDMRGSGGRHSAVTEENLLGEHTPIGHGGHYQDGYSTTTHEFTHTVHRYGLDAHDQKLITDTFNQKQGDPNAAWPDGPRHDGSGKPVDNYSSRDEQEYFAQVTNAYLGTNHGTDPYTGQPRNNGADWVRQNEPAMLPLLERLYGKDPGAVHTGPANPVHATTAENQMYEGFRDFMDRVDGNGSTTPAHQPPTTPPPTPPAANPGQHGGGSSHLPPPPPKAPGFGSKPAAGDGYSHKIDGEKTFDAIKDFLPDSAEFDKVKDNLKKYERSALIDGDTDAILHSYQQQKQLHVDVLRRNVPESLDAVNHRLDEITHQTPDRQAELAGEKHNLETAKAHLEGQRDRLAVYEHELARLKGEPKPGTPELKALQDARQQAEPRIAKDAMARIEEQRKAVADLRQEADQRLNDAETAYQNENSKRTATGSTKETAAEAAAKTTRNVFASRVEDLKVRDAELAQDLQARKDALAGNYGPTPPKPKKGAEHELTDGAYRAAFGYSDHGVMAGEPHAEKTVRRMVDGDVKLGAAVVNRNHVVADYMVHKYVTAAVFKARSFGDEQHRVEASKTFSDFADTMAPDQHRVYDKDGKRAAKRLDAKGGVEHAALTWRDLGYTAKDVDLRAAYGNDRLAPAFSPAKMDDPASAGAAKQELQNQLNRSGLDGPAKAQFDRYADTVARFSDDPSPQHLAEMKDALADVHTKVREQAVEDLGVVHGVTGPRHLDDTVAAARQAAAEPPGGPGGSPAHERLADRLDDLAGAYDRLGQDRQDLKSLAHDLRNDPNAVRPEQLEAFADKLPNEREQLRRDEVQHRLDEAGETLRPGGTPAAIKSAAAKLLPKADADIRTVGEQYGGAFPRAGAGEKHPAGLFDQAVKAKVEDVPKLIEEITAGLSNSASNLRFGDELTNKWIQNFLDPHVVRDQDVLTAVAKGDLPPEALYSPHTLDLLRGLRTLEDTGLAPRELRDLMAPKTEADMVDLHGPGQKPSASAVNIADEHGMLNHAGGETPVSSSGDFTRQPGQSANPVVGSEALHDPGRDARPGAEGREIGATPPPATPHPAASQDTDVVMASQGHDTPTGSQDHDTPMPSQSHGTPTPTPTQGHDVPMLSQSQDHPMASQQTTRPDKRRQDSGDDVLMAQAPPLKRRQTGAVPTPPPPPPVSHPAASGHQGTGTRGFGTLPSPPPPTGNHTPAAGQHNSASGSGTSHHPAVEHGGTAEHQGQQHEADPQQHHEDTDQQPHDDQQTPPVEPLLPPVGTPEYGIMHDPGSFLRDTPLGVDFGSGLKLRTEGLQQHQVNSFLARFESSDRHWFALVRDPARSTPDKDAFVLTPAWEKYAQHSEEFRPPAGVRLPDPMPDHHYVTALYAPYKSGTAGADHTIGHVEVPLHPDPARPGDGLVFTGGMNGCAFVATDVNPHTDTFQLWHFQSYSANNNLIGGADFRAGKTVTDWFGPDEYRSPHPFTFEVTNVLHHGPDGWHVTSQESVQEQGNPHLGQQTTRPFRLDPPSEADRVRMTVGPYHINAKEQVERFDDLANKLQSKLPPATDPNFRTVRNDLLGQLGDLRGRLVAQADAVGALAQPDTTMQQVHDGAAALHQQAAANHQHAQGESMLFTARMSAMGHSNPRFHELEALQRQLFDEFAPQNDRSWLSVMSRDSAGQLQSMADAQHNPAQGFGALPASPPPAATHGTGTTEHRQPEPMDVDQPDRTVPHQRDADGDAVMHEPAQSNDRKRGRSEDDDQDDQPVVEREVKRRRTPSYENTDAVMHDRGYQAVAAQHPLTQDLVRYLGGEPKVHPPMSSSLLGKVNPHAAPVHPAEGFRVGNDLNACLENVEAYRDTHFGRPRVSGQTLHGNVEPIPGNTLWKRHDGPALFGEGDAAVGKLMETVRAGGPGSFATVLGAGKEGAGHAVALVHDRDGQLRWADLTDRKVTPATGGMPENFRSDWTVWASVADPHENNISGPHDPNFMDTYSTFTRPRTEHTPEPMDVDDFGTVPPSEAVGRFTGHPDDADGQAGRFAEDRLVALQTHTEQIYEQIQTSLGRLALGDEGLTGRPDRTAAELQYNLWSGPERWASDAELGPRYGSAVEQTGEYQAHHAPGFTMDGTAYHYDALDQLKAAGYPDSRPPKDPEYQKQLVDWLKQNEADGVPYDPKAVEQKFRELRNAATGTKNEVQDGSTPTDGPEVLVNLHGTQFRNAWDIASDSVAESAALAMAPVRSYGLDEPSALGTGTAHPAPDGTVQARQEIPMVVKVSDEVAGTLRENVQLRHEIARLAGDEQTRNDLTVLAARAGHGIQQFQDGAHLLETGRRPEERAQSARQMLQGRNEFLDAIREFDARLKDRELPAADGGHGNAAEWLRNFEQQGAQQGFGSRLSETQAPAHGDAPPPPPPPPAFRTGPVSRSGDVPPPPPPPTTTDHPTIDHTTNQHTPMDVDSPPAPPQRRTLAVAVQTAVVGNPHGPLRGQDVFLSEVVPSNDRPMTRFGTDQRSHTVPWALTRRAAGGLAGRDAASVWTELKADVAEFQKFPPEAKGAAQKDHAAVKARWDDIVNRLNELPDHPPAHQSLQEWHRNLGDLVSGYIEISQITSFASFADGRAVGHGEAGMLDRLGRFEEQGGQPPRTDEVVGTLLDIKQSSSLSPEDAKAAKEHLIRSLHRAYPSYMTQDRRTEIEQQLGLRPVAVHPTGQLPPGASGFTRYELKAELVADIVADPHNPAQIGKIVLSEQSRPDTQFGSNQYSHAASWSLMRESLLSFEGKPQHELETWLGNRFDSMDAHGNLDPEMSQAVDHARRELASMDSYPPHERAARVGDLVRVFVSAHQKLPHTTFVDQVQLGSATSSGELDFGLRGGPRHDNLVASHFDGAAPFNTSGDRLVRSYQSWQNMAETLGPVRQETVNLVADRTFTDKNLQQLRAAGLLTPVDNRIGSAYLEGLLSWDRGVTTAFPAHGNDAVTTAWQAHRDEFTVERFGRPTDPGVRRQVEAWFDQVRTADRPSDAGAALEGLSKYYEALSNQGRRGTERGALAAALPPPPPAGGKRRGDDTGDIARQVRRIGLDD
ncbi:hypothetical protein [Kitasatospora sp. NPDC085879]|uniref:hypothetical protein n=1 Tax=Kitasatospora sp. NPDC085879 TaxID=3154769 RepID=UPI0034425E1D